MLINHQFLTEVLHYCPASGVFTYKVKRGKSMPGERAGYDHVSGYRHVGFCGKSFKEHRLAWFYVHGRWPDGDLDHINGKPGDNRISNLRVVNDSLNCLNKKWDATKNKAGFRGVSRHKSERGKPKWRVRVTDSGGRRVSIGNFDSLEDAIKARIKAEDRYYSQYAPSNGCMKESENRREVEREVCLMR